MDDTTLPSHDSVHLRPGSTWCATCHPVPIGTATAGGAHLAAALPCLSCSAVQARLFPFFPYFSATFGAQRVVQILALWPVCWTVPLDRSPARPSLLLLQSHLSPGVRWGWGSGEASTSALCTAGLAGCTSVWPQKHQIQSNCKGVYNEGLWPTSYSIIGFGLVYMGRLHQFSLSLFLKWFG